MMRKNKTSKGYLLFAFLSTFLVLIFSLSIVLLALNDSKGNTFGSYPTYRYEEYVDQTISSKFLSGSGAQLYEAEKVDINNNIEVINNIGASGGKSIKFKKSYSSLNLSFQSNAEIEVKLILNINYNSKFDRDINASSLFSVSLNGKEIDLENIYIKHCFNSYDYLENEIAVLPIKEGNNSLQILSKSENFFVDYLLLISPNERNGTYKEIGFKYDNFVSSDGSQRFEAENAKQINSKIQSSTTSSRGFYSLLSQDGDKITYHLDVENDYRTDLRVSLKKESQNVLNGFMNLIVNDERLNIPRITLNVNSFKEYYLGPVVFKKGKNTLTIERTNSTFLIDYIVLNGNINYSKSESIQKYEAEKCTIYDGIVNSDSLASGGESVAFSKSDSYLILNVNSLANEHNSVVVRFKTLREFKNLNELFIFTLNNKPIEILDYKLIYESEGYISAFINTINITKGSNSLKITSKDIPYDIDMIIFNKTKITDSIDTLTLEAEKNLYAGNSKIEFNSEASGEENIGYIQKDSYVNFYVFSDKDIELNLSISFSNYLSKDENLENFCNIFINDSELDISNKKMRAAYGWTNFTETDVGAVTLTKGINAIKIKCVNSESYNIDYISLIK